MKKQFKLKKVYKKLGIILLIIYLSFYFIKQEKDLNFYKKEQKNYENQISQKILEQKELNDIKSNINSKEYIEKVAREKLDMYLPNERVYIDKCK